jgi:hypothetical protein
MRGALAGIVAAAAVAAGTVCAGCVIITGSTDGYHGPDAGGDGAADGGPAVSLACVSAADCGDGGNVCCLVVNSSLTGATTACQSAPCAGTIPVQLCTSTAECGKTGLCTKQACNFSATSVTIEACGTVPTCSPLS